MNNRLRAFLEDNGATAHVHPHQPVYTAQEVAATEHVSGHAVAKVVMAVADSRMVMLVLPASHRVDLARVREAVGAREARLATEEEFRGLFPDCELGAMPPFGHLYGVPVFVDPELATSPVVMFEAGSHREVCAMPYAEFQRLEHPRLTPLAV